MAKTHMEGIVACITNFYNEETLNKVILSNALICVSIVPNLSHIKVDERDIVPIVNDKRFLEIQKPIENIK
jgi:hypothetical protein